MPKSGRELARLIDIELDESIGRSTPDVEHERAVADLRPHRGEQLFARSATPATGPTG